MLNILLTLFSLPKRPNNPKKDTIFPFNKIRQNNTQLFDTQIIGHIPHFRGLFRMLIYKKILKIATL